jgi:hypothetical protein
MARSSDVAKVALWRERFSRWEAAGVKTAEFCRAEGVSQPSFYAWRRKLGLSLPRFTRPAGRDAFQQVFVATPAVSAHLPGGVRIDVSAHDERSLRMVVDALVRSTQDSRVTPC